LRRSTRQGKKKNKSEFEIGPKVADIFKDSLLIERDENENFDTLKKNLHQYE